eukprot:TCONS_00057966-protein
MWIWLCVLGLIVAMISFCSVQQNVEPMSVIFERKLNTSSEVLKKYYIETIGQQNLKTINKVYRNKKRFYVELMIATKENSDDVFSKSNRDSEAKDHHQKVTIDQLLDSNRENNMVLIQGAGGVGKSFMLETAALHWAEGKIWPDIKFVFLLTFRELNLYTNTSFKEVLSKKFKMIFRGLEISDLDSIGDQTVILMDGVDEFAKLNETLSHEHQSGDNSVASGFYELIKSNFLPGRNLIITGRTSSCDQLRSKFKELSIKSLNGLGFNTSQMNQYIKNYFNLNESKAENLIVAIQKHENLKLMAKTPAFLWSLCELHQNTDGFEEIETVTPLFILQLSLFIQEHLR